MKHTKTIAGVLSLSLLLTGCGSEGSSKTETASKADTTSKAESSSAAEQNSQASQDEQSTPEDSAPAPTIEAKPAQYTDRDYMTLVSEEGYEAFGGTIKDMFGSMTDDTVCYLTEDHRLLFSSKYDLLLSPTEIKAPDTAVGFADVLMSKGFALRHTDGTVSVWNIESEYPEDPIVTMLHEGLSVEDGTFICILDDGAIAVPETKNGQLCLSTYGCVDYDDAKNLPMIAGNVTTEFENSMGALTEFVPLYNDYCCEYYLRDENNRLYPVADFFNTVTFRWDTTSDPPYSQLNIFETVLVENFDRAYCMFSYEDDAPVYSLITDENTIYVRDPYADADEWTLEEGWSVPLPDGLTTKDIKAIYPWTYAMMIVTHDNRVYYTGSYHDNLHDQVRQHDGLTDLFSNGNVVSIVHNTDIDVSDCPFVLMDDGHIYQLSASVIYNFLDDLA